MIYESRPVGVIIEASAQAVYDYVSDPTKLPEWARGLAGSTVEQSDGRWFTESPMGRVEIDFAPHNDFGVLDHAVTLPDGSTTMNPMRVIANGDGAEVMFIVRKREGMSFDQWDADCAAVADDLESLRVLFEGDATLRDQLR